MKRRLTEKFSNINSSKKKNKFIFNDNRLGLSDDNLNTNFMPNQIIKVKRFFFLPVKFRCYLTIDINCVENAID